MAPMDVLCVNARADFAGGAERYIADVASGLRRRGHRVSLAYGVASAADPGFVSHFDGAFPLVDVARQLESLRPDLVYVHQLRQRRFVRALGSARQPVVRYFHDHALFCLREHKYTTLRGATCTRTVGSRCYPCLGFVGRGPLGSIGVRTVRGLRAEQAENRSFDAFVVGSAYMRRQVVAHGFPADRVHVNLPFVSRLPAAEGTRDPNSILFVGALVRGKGLDVLLRAMARLPAHLCLKVVGVGHQEAWFRGMGRSLSLGSRVRFEGTLSRDALGEAYARAGCLVMPSRTPETFGLIGPEAMLLGTPVIASAVGGTGEWLVPGQTGLSFPSGDEVRLAEAIRRLTSDRDLASRLGAAGRVHSESRFTLERHLTRLESLFTGLVERCG